MKKKKLKLKKHWRIILNLSLVTIVLFSVNKTFSGYRTIAHVSTTNAIPILSIEATPSKELEFIDYGWATHSFDIVNGKLDEKGVYYVNEIDMEYYIKIVQDSEELPLKLLGLYYLNDDRSLGEAIPYVEGKGYGPIDLPYKVDDETVLNDQGYYESKYVKRTHFMLAYTYTSCSQGDQHCILDANHAGKDYKFHIEATAYQKVN